MHSTGAPKALIGTASSTRGPVAAARAWRLGPARLAAWARRRRLAWRIWRSGLAGPDSAFSAAAYLAANADVAAAGAPALAHYLVQGWAEGRPLRPGSHEAPRLPLSAVLGWRDWLRARLRPLHPCHRALRPAAALHPGAVVRLRTPRGPMPSGWCRIAAEGPATELLIMAGGRTQCLQIPAAPAAILVLLPDPPAQLALRRQRGTDTAPPTVAVRELGRLHAWRAARHLPRRLPGDCCSYQAWVALYDTPNDVQRAAMAQRSARLAAPPRFRVQLTRPGTAAERDALAKTVAAQIYPHVEAGRAQPGEFAVLLEPGAVLAPHALLLLAETLVADPTLDLLYADQDRLVDGLRQDPWFKPDHSAERLAEQDLFGALGVIRADLLNASCANGTGPDWARLAGSRRVGHVPHILAHAGRMPAIAAAAPDGGPEPCWPAVTAIVPTRDQAGLLETCLAGLLDGTDYPALRIVVADNGSVEPTTAALLARMARRGVAVRPCPGPFNYAAINNAAAAGADTELLLFLNDDVSVADPGWLKQMVRLARPGIGAVGARLLYPSGALQHGGVVLGMGGVAGHPHLGSGPDEPGHGGRLRLTQEVAAVTAACMLVPARHFASVGGFDATHLPVAFNDVDLCLRLRRAGLRILWTPRATLHHRESASRISDFSPQRLAGFAAEIAHMQSAWGEDLTNDPFFSPNLSLDSTDLAYAFPPRVPRPWAASSSAASSSAATRSAAT